MFLPRKALALTLFLALLAPVLAASSACACSRVASTHACCRGSAGAVSISAPRGCCKGAQEPETKAELVVTASAQVKIPAPDEASTAHPASGPARSMMLPADGSSGPRPAQASWSPPDLRLTHCSLLI